MGIVLKVTPDVLIRIAGDIEKQLKDMKTQFGELHSDINGTRSFWEGEASDTHKAQYDALVPEIQNALDRLQKRPEELLKMAGIYNDVEDIAKETAMSLVEDVIV